MKKSKLEKAWEWYANQGSLLQILIICVIAFIGWAAAFSLTYLTTPDENINYGYIPPTEMPNEWQDQKGQDQNHDHTETDSTYLWTPNWDAPTAYAYFELPDGKTFRLESAYEVQESGDKLLYAEIIPSQDNQPYVYDQRQLLVTVVVRYKGSAPHIAQINLTTKEPVTSSLPDGVDVALKVYVGERRLCGTINIEGKQYFLLFQEMNGEGNKLEGDGLTI